LLLLLSSSIYRFRYSYHYTIYLRIYQRVITSSRSHTSRINREREVVRSTCKFSWVYATSSLIHLQKPSRTCPHTNTPASHPDNQPVLGPLQTRKQSVTERKASTTCHPHPSTHEYILSQDTSINIVVGVAFPSRIQHRVGTLLHTAVYS